MSESAPLQSLLESQPHAIVERDGVRYTLLGTAHVSKASVDAVRAAIASGEFDAVSIELDAQRLHALTDPDALAKLDLVKVLREGKTALFAANLGLAAYQRRLAEQLGIEPGAELKAAATDAKERGLPLHLIDRDVGLTFKRAMQRLGWWGRAKMSAGLMVSLFGDEEVGDAADRGPQGRRHARGQLRRVRARKSGAVRDDHRRARPLHGRAPARDFGDRTQRTRGDRRRPSAGSGQAFARRHDAIRARCAPNSKACAEKSSIPWFTIVLTAFVLGGFAWGFWRGGFDVGADLVLQWVLVTGTLGALGCAIAGGHPLSILAAFVASPLTPLHPALASGTVSALVEAWIRKPTYADFMALRDDVQTLRGWWRNRVARVLLNFFLTSLGTAIGVWTGGLSMLGKIIG